MTDLRPHALLAGILPLAASLLLSGAAMSAEVKVGYLGLTDDPRYLADVTYARIELNPAGDPVAAAKMGLADLEMVTAAVDKTLQLDHRTAADAAGLVDAIKDMAASGEQFIILDLPAPLTDEVAAATRDLGVTLINGTAPDDFLRNRCHPNLLHAAASDRMEADALVQYLRTRNWTKVLMLVGPETRDKEMAAAFRLSAERQRINLVDEREFTLLADPANRDANNTLLITGGVEYDLVYVADSQGEFARYLPYSTQLPRPIIGSTGLVASEWHWGLERYGAPQVSSRFAEFAPERRMTGPDWSVWMAAKAIATAYAKARSDEPAKIDAYLRGSRLKLDGSKGVQMNFRPWDGQMRMPVVLSTHNSVIAIAPLEGYLHQNNTLDTLGTDEPEHKCQ